MHRYQVTSKVNTIFWIFVAMRKNPISFVSHFGLAYCFIGVIRVGDAESRNTINSLGLRFDGAF